MIKLISCDMDGTLLDSNKRLPDHFLENIERLREIGVQFAIASGRQYAALRRDLEALVPHILFICENGALVMQQDRRLLIDPIDPSQLSRIIRTGRKLQNVYPIVCCADVAYIEESASEQFKRESGLYYGSIQIVPDLMACCDRDDVCKVAFYDDYDAQTHTLPVLASELSGDLGVILSASHWVDVMKPGVNKGRAMEGLQRMLNITPDECMAFGDYLNDCELLASVTESYCMANGHEQLKAMAKYIAPSNDEDGVMRVIRERFQL